MLRGVHHALLCFAVFALAARPPMSWAQEAGGVRALFVNEIRNNKPAFMVRVDVDRSDRTYREGQAVKFNVRSEKDGYLYLLNCRTDGLVLCLFPNNFQTDNRISAAKEIQVPAEDAKFTVDVGAPYSNDKLEVVKAIVCLEPLEIIKVEQMVKAFGVEIPEGTYKALYPRELKQRPAASWGEHHIEIRTLAANFKHDEKRPRQIAVVIGIQDFVDRKIRKLQVSRADAIQMGKVLKETCGFDEIITLTDAQATLANIERTIRRELAEKTRPGDTVVIYWSGHGGRCADDNNDEKSGFDAFLVTHDGQYDSIETIRNTMLMDDTFGRWIQELDGRRMAVILDTCHSGGQAKEAKALGADFTRYGKGLGSLDGPVDGNYDFLDGELARTKDIGQRDAVILASSMANQISFERREGDLSVFTFYLLEFLRTSAGKASLDTAHAFAARQVPMYVERNFPGTTQTPVMLPPPPTGLVLTR